MKIATTTIKKHVYILLIQAVIYLILFVFSSHIGIHNIVFYWFTMFQTVAISFLKISIWIKHIHKDTDSQFIIWTIKKIFIFHLVSLTDSTFKHIFQRKKKLREKILETKHQKILFYIKVILCCFVVTTVLTSGLVFFSRRENLHIHI